MEVNKSNGELESVSGCATACLTVCGYGCTPLCVASFFIGSSYSTAAGIAAATTGGAIGS